MSAQIFFTSVWLDRDRPFDLQTFEAQVVAVPEIIECHYITGSVDYILRAVTQDFDTYIGIMDRLRNENANICRWETSALVREVKMTTTPLERLERSRRAGMGRD